METIKSTVSSVCIVSAGLFAVRCLIADQTLRIRAETILKMIFALVLISPFVRGGFSIELPELTEYELADNSFSRQAYMAELAKQTAENIQQVLMEQINASGVKCENISADVNISEDGSIFISKVTVRADDPEMAADIVRNCLGSDTEVINEYS